MRDRVPGAPAVEDPVVGATDGREVVGRHRGQRARAEAGDHRVDVEAHLVHLVQPGLDDARRDLHRTRRDWRSGRRAGRRARPRPRTCRRPRPPPPATAGGPPPASARRRSRGPRYSMSAKIGSPRYSARAGPEPMAKYFFEVSVAGTLSAQPAYCEAMQASSGRWTFTSTPGSARPSRSSWRNWTSASPARHTSANSRPASSVPSTATPASMTRGAVLQLGHRHAQRLGRGAQPFGRRRTHVHSDSARTRTSPSPPLPASPTKRRNSPSGIHGPVTRPVASRAGR